MSSGITVSIIPFLNIVRNIGIFNAVNDFLNEVEFLFEEFA